MKNPDRITPVIRALAVCFGAASAFCSATAGAAESPLSAQYPQKPIQLIVPAAPGGALDLLGRAMADQLRARLNTPVVVTNRAGAGGLVGAQALKRALPDGYTLLVHVDSLLAFQTFVKTDVDAEKDFTPVAMFAESPYLLVVNPKLPVKSLAEMVSFARANPDKLNFAYQPNSRPYLQLLRFLNQSGIRAGTIPYGGGGPIHAALLANEVQVYVGAPTGLIESVRSGALRALAMGGARAVQAFPPGIPFARASGLEGDFEYWSTWYGFFAAAPLPREILTTLSDAIVEITRKPEVEAQIRQLGSEPAPVGWQEFASMTARVTAATKAAAQAAKLAVPQ